MSRALHLILLLGVMLGLTLPKTSAALADLGVISGEFVVICTGHGIERVSLSDLGQEPPAQDGVHDPQCLLVHALDHATTPDRPLWLRIARSFPRADTVPPALPAEPLLLALARAPPRV
ncbi:hypothetical protein Q4511_07250 [Paracoccus sp. 1_MG-2023]|uniref:hypothetical protein n=1 Tax=unclassified Paracoccus (in: a-proteobacteria) TaxID=2688777 RepID=UPI001C09A81B|nr:MULTISPECIES: hypothetical protein [unclassified Paracoccus (in: a-proteobacteria)]MBU2956609.1 hypothetical protein [Paracoccus sp. C2R09]MDO6668715.1 hypothetical protein [Paracoccus sp. 1_MG-2023]